jgi:hypothetical protein
MMVFQKYAETIFLWHAIGLLIVQCMDLATTSLLGNNLVRLYYTRSFHFAAQ